MLDSHYNILCWGYASDMSNIQDIYEQLCYLFTCIASQHLILCDITAAPTRFLNLYLEQSRRPAIGHGTFWNVSEGSKLKAES